jgi:hypothetical protein
MIPATVDGRASGGVMTLSWSLSSISLVILTMDSYFHPRSSSFNRQEEAAVPFIATVTAGIDGTGADGE